MVELKGVRLVRETSSLASFPHQGSTQEKFEFLVDFAIQAPSVRNSQPWVFRLRDDYLEIAVDCRRQLPVLDPHGREAVISCGAALYNLRLGLRGAGYGDLVDFHPTPTLEDWLVRLTIEHAALPLSPGDARKFAAIPLRHTHRQLFLPRLPPEPVVEALHSAARNEGARLVRVPDELRATVAELVLRSDHRLASDRHARAELARFLRANRSRSGDGILGLSLGLGDRLSTMAPWLERRFGHVHSTADVSVTDADGSPLLMVLEVGGDEPGDWLRAGQALQSVLLAAAAEGLQASFFSSPLRLTACRDQLRTVLSLAEYPQMLMRLGYPIHKGHATPRRPRWEVISDVPSAVRFPPTPGVKRQIQPARGSRLRELTNLYLTSQILSSTLSLGQLLDRLCLHMRNLVEANASTTYLLDGKQLVLRASSGWAPSRVESLRGPAVEKALASGRPVVARAGDAEFPLCWSAQGYHCALVVPLGNSKYPLGVCNLLYRASRRFTRVQVNLLRLMAGQAAVAIENTRLFEEQQHVADLLRGLLVPSQGLGFGGVEVGHRFLPSLDLSGDYYDLISLGEKRFALVIADVEGKGPDAAIETARAKFVIQSQAHAGLRPAMLLELLNTQTLAPRCRTLTVFYAEVDLNKMQLRYACAGHEPPLWIEPEGKVGLLKKRGLLVGALGGTTYPEGVVTIRPGSAVVLYTDGITEARSPSSELFGVRRLIRTARRYHALSPQRLVDQIYQRVRSYSKGQLSDDVSLLAVRF